MAVNKVIQSVASIFTGHRGQQVVPRSFFRTASAAANIDTLSTGMRPLDKALGIGGLPCGKITELAGPGKPPVSDGVHCIAARIGARVQRRQQMVVVVDMAHNFDPWQAERCGLMASQMLVSQPDTLFAALTTLEDAARAQGLIVVNIGFVSDLLNHAEPELLTTLLRRVRTIVRQSESAFLFITHLSDNDPFNPANYPVGFPLAALADIRLWVQDENWQYNDNLATTYKASLAVIKNNLSPPGIGTDLRIKLTSP